MRAFIVAIIVLAVTLGCAVASDLYCRDVCMDIERAVRDGGEAGAKNALEKFGRNEFLLKLSVDNGYVSEAEVSLRSLNVAYEHNDAYETARYLDDTLVRVRRVRYALII